MSHAFQLSQHTLLAQYPHNSTEGFFLFGFFLGQQKWCIIFDNSYVDIDIYIVYKLHHPIMHSSFSTFFFLK